MDLLILLAANPGKLILRREMVTHIWGENHYLRDETAINTAVRKVRAALADDVERPRFIETVTGKGYRFIAPIHTAPETGAAELLKPRRRILVVLPFEDLSTPPLEPYLTDGIMEQMITSLGAAAPDRLGIIGRTSALACRLRGLTVKEIGRELEADLVIEGSVRRQEAGLRINVRLLHVGDQAQLWAKSYQKDLEIPLSWSDVAAEIICELTISSPLASIAVPAGHSRILRELEETGPGRRSRRRARSYTRPMLRLSKSGVGPCGWGDPFEKSRRTI